MNDTLRAPRLFATLLLAAAVVCLHGLCGLAHAEESDDADADAPETTAGIVLKGGMPVSWPPEGDPRPYADSPYAKQIDKALAYLLYNTGQGDPWSTLLLLDFLQRKFELHQRYAITTTYAPHLRSTYGEESDNPLFNRRIDPDYTMTLEEIEATHELQRPSLRALFCDLLPLTDAFFEEITTILEGEQQFFHVLGGVTYLLLRDNGCALDDARVAKLRDLSAAKLRRVALVNMPDKGLAYNAVALLYGMGFSRHVEERWLQQIAEAQNDDGGWSSHAFTDSEGGATAHAVWALLEHALPDAPQTPWIPNNNTEERQQELD